MFWTKSKEFNLFKLYEYIFLKYKLIYISDTQVLWLYYTYVGQWVRIIIFLMTPLNTFLYLSCKLLLYQLNRLRSWLCKNINTKFFL